MVLGFSLGLFVWTQLIAVQQSSLIESGISALTIVIPVTIVHSLYLSPSPPPVTAAQNPFLEARARPCKFVKAPAWDEFLKHGPANGIATDPFTSTCK